MDRHPFSTSRGLFGLAAIPVVLGLLAANSLLSDSADATAADPGAGATAPATADPASPVPDPGPAAAEAEGSDAARESGTRIATLRNEIERSLPRRRWPGSSWGVLVTSLDRGDTLYALNAHEPMAPASNAKILTTAAAIHHLGVDFRYRTFLLANGPVEDGVLRGDLVLYGTGDPSISGLDRPRSRDPLRRMARQLRERGINRIDGDVVGDGSYFQGPLRPEGWRSRNLNEWFAAPVGALQYNENLALLRIRPGAEAGRPVRVETIPDGAPLTVRVRALTVSRRTGHRVWALRDAPDLPVSITGQIRPQDPDVWRRMTVSEPALYAARQLRLALEAEGIRVGGAERVVRDPASSTLGKGGLWAPALAAGTGPPPRVLLEHRSAPLLDLLWVVNRRSHNLYAESILRTLGRVVDGEGSFEGGIRVVRRYLTEEVGVPPEEAVPVDGSGLSPENRVSPYTLVRVVEHMAQSADWGSFWSTLPQAGNWRELRRMYRSPAADNLRAKTGTLRRVSALTGVVEARNGERLAFSILSNEVPSTSAAKAVEDRIGIQLASFARPFDGPAPVRDRAPLAAVGGDRD